jgi:hypothetical protein
MGGVDATAAGLAIALLDRTREASAAAAAFE